MGLLPELGKVVTEKTAKKNKTSELKHLLVFFSPITNLTAN